MIFFLPHIQRRNLYNNQYYSQRILYNYVINSVCLRSDEMVVSLDVSSLFTNVPIDEAVSVIRDKLQNDQSLDERTCLSPECITELLEVCLLDQLTLGTMGTVVNKL